MKEIERRWRLNQIPKWKDIENHYVSTLHIIQYYEKNYDYRIRRTFDGENTYKYYHTIKKGSGLIREEIEKEISEEEFYKYFHHISEEGYPLEKKRVVVGTGILHIYIDDIYYINECFCEVEFISKEDAESFILPDYINNYVDREVTNDNSYSNYQLAKKYIESKRV